MNIIQEQCSIFLCVNIYSCDGRYASASECNPPPPAIPSSPYPTSAAACRIELQGNTYQVDPSFAGRKLQLIEHKSTLDESTLRKVIADIEQNG